MEKIRSERQYTVEMSEECGSSETATTIIPAGTESAQNTAAALQARATAEDWAREGEWDYDGAETSVRYTLSDQSRDRPYISKCLVTFIPTHKSQ